MWNIQSVSNSLTVLNIENTIVNNPEDIHKFNKIILPWVGAFKEAMVNLNKLWFSTEIKKYIKNKDNYILWICLWMQLLLDSSEENWNTKWLWIIEWKVLSFNNIINNLPIPHVWWNNINISKKSKILNWIDNNDNVYFVHSYYCSLINKEDILLTTNYWIGIDVWLEKDNIFWTQFHPEKSQEIWLKILYNFSKI